VSSLFVNLGQSSGALSGPGQARERAGKSTLCPLSAMSSGRLFLDGVLASIARLLSTGGTRLKRLLARKKVFIIDR